MISKTTQSTTYCRSDSRGTGDSILFLFGSSVSGRVLIVGNSLAHWRLYYPDGRFEEDLFSIREDRDSYDLVLYHSGSATSRSILKDHMEILLQLASKGVKILFFGENSYSVSNLKKYGILGSISATKGPKVRPGGYRKILDASGLKVAKEFIGLPSLESSEELVVPGSRFLEIPRQWHSLWRWAKDLGLIHVITGGSVFFIAPGILEDGPLFKTVERHIGKHLDSEFCSCVVERIDIRLRGNLVLFVTEVHSKKSFITRIVSDPLIRTVVRRNQTFLSSIRKSVEYVEPVKGKLPEPIGEMEFANSSLFTETLMDGILAWKVTRGSLKRTIFKNASQFIFGLQSEMRRRAVYSEENVKSLFQEDLDELQACPNIDPFLMETVAREIQTIRQYMSGRECFLTVSHGDYGYGNILVDPQSGQITGVIDWDTGRNNDLPGIDYLNMIVQKNRVERGSGVSEAFHETCTTAMRRESLDEEGFYASSFNLTGDMLKVVLFAGLIRYMSRAAKYPEVFASEQADYQRSFNELKNIARL